MSGRPRVSGYLLDRMPGAILKLLTAAIESRLRNQRVTMSLPAGKNRYAKSRGHIECTVRSVRRGTNDPVIGIRHK